MSQTRPKYLVACNPAYPVMKIINKIGRIASARIFWTGLYIKITLRNALNAYLQSIINQLFLFYINVVGTIADYQFTIYLQCLN